MLFFPAPAARYYPERDMGQVCIGWGDRSLIGPLEPMAILCGPEWPNAFCGPVIAKASVGTALPGKPQKT